MQTKETINLHPPEFYTELFCAYQLWYKFHHTQE